MRANDRKTYLATSNTNSNRFFNGYFRNYNENSVTNSLKGSVTSGKSFLPKVKEEPEELNLDSGSSVFQNYAKINAHFNKNFAAKSYNLNPNSNKNYSSNNTPGFFSAKSKFKKIKFNQINQIGCV